MSISAVSSSGTNTYNNFFYQNPQNKEEVATICKENQYEISNTYNNSTKKNNQAVDASLALCPSPQVLVNLAEYAFLFGTFNTDASLNTFSQKTTTNQGSSISITEKLQKNVENEAKSYKLMFTSIHGQEINLNITNNTTISENSDGTISVYSATSNKTNIYAKDGSISEVLGDFTEENADTTIINIDGKSITTGNGNDIIFNFADDAHIVTNNGDDTIYINAKNLDIELGEGNNTVHAKEIINSTIIGGDGNNSIEIQGSGIFGSQINLGHGDNKLKGINSFSFVKDSSITLGNGNNTVDVHQLSTSSLDTGEGDNSIKIFQIGSEIHDKSDNDTQEKTILNLGNGDNILGIYISLNSSINTGNGNNFIDISQMTNSDSSIGNGDNKINMHIVDSSSIDIGDGDNLVKLFRNTHSTIDFGMGSNKVDVNTLHDVTINAGLDLFLEALEIHNSSINAENGNITIDSYQIKDTSLDFGDGNNSINAMHFENSHANLGDGNNSIEIFSISHASSINMGTGNNHLRADYLKDTSTVETKAVNNNINILNKAENASVYVNAEEVNSFPHAHALLTEENFVEKHKKYQEKQVLAYEHLKADF